MRRALLPVLGGLLAAAGAPLPSADNLAAPTALNWELPLLSKEGYHTMTLHGSQATYRDNNRMDVVDLAITTFAGGAAPRVETVLLSPLASFLARENRASGPEAVRVIRDDFEVTGRDWTYDYNARRVTIARETRIVLHFQLGNILK